MRSVGVLLAACLLVPVSVSGAVERSDAPAGDATAARAARDAVARVAASDGTWDVRMDGLAAVARAGDDAVPVLADALKLATPPVGRSFAAQALAGLADRRAVAGLIGALDDPEPEVRVYAAQALGRIGGLSKDQDERARRALERVRKEDRLPLVRGAAAWALDRDEEGTAAKAIRAALAEYDPRDADTARLDEPAPDVMLVDAEGKSHRLSDFRGKRPVVLKFYFVPL